MRSQCDVTTNNRVNMDIDWKGMPHGVLTAELQRGFDERAKRIEELEAIGVAREAQQSPRPRGRPPKNGSEFPDNARGALDAAGDA